MPAAERTATPPPPSCGPRSLRVLLTAWGSYGDLHPMMALARGLRERGHRPVLAAPNLYREKVTGEGLEFRPLRPDLPPEHEAQGLIARVMDPRRGTETIIRDTVMPHVREQYDDLLPLCREADLVVSHPVTFAAPVAAEKLGVPRAAALLMPMGFVSAYDPPVPPNSPALASLFWLGPGFLGALLRLAKRQVRPWAAPVDRLRQEEGLPPDPHPIFEGQFSPLLNLGLFSPVFGAPQPDWPEHTVVTGFPFYDRRAAGEGMPEALRQFLDAGPPPIVFTLGSSAVMMGGDFYVESVRAAQSLGRRAVLLAGKAEWNRLPQPLPEGVFACEYAPHSEVFPRAAAVVHQCGIGTTGQALRAGKPVLAVPFAHDQPDNAHRQARLGMARVVQRRDYSAARAGRELRRLLEDPAYARAAADIGARVRAEDGVGAACTAIEDALARVR